MPASTIHPALHFRAATLADRDALIALVTSAYRGETSRQGWTTEADLLDGPRIAPEVLEHDLTRPRSRVVVAGTPEMPLLACAHVCDEGGAGYFGMFAVRPERQGGGIGDAGRQRDGPAWTCRCAAAADASRHPAVRSAGHCHDPLRC